MPVINCKVQNIRPKYENLKEWIDDPNNVYIGRAGVVFVTNEETGVKERFPKEASIFANPYKVGKDGTRAEVIEKYKVYIVDKLKKNPAMFNTLMTMKGKNLGCWCKPESCHGDFLLELIETS